ncbi:unnamed protein product [Larinioides sclopetarius]|uniref:Uncharacterized protein n=1 Tax=Larinioides sclopetarius TaxID=280406 RepID=A0AAV2AES8_9ARAC
MNNYEWYKIAAGVLVVLVPLAIAFDKIVSIIADKIRPEFDNMDLQFLFESRFKRCWG